MAQLSGFLGIYVGNTGMLQDGGMNRGFLGWVSTQAGKRGGALTERAVSRQ